MKKETRIIIGICGIFLVLAVVFFVKQQNHVVSGVKFETAASAEPADTSASDKTGEDADSTKKSAVYVSGAVKKPGLYHYSGTKRVGDAIHAVGGFKKSADKDGINLAQILTDGEHIIVPDTKKKKKTETRIQDSSPETDKVNINTATKKQLMTLTGIGEAKADAIIEYRTTNGSFQKIEDLMKISGIKEGIFEKIKALISIS